MGKQFLEELWNCPRDGCGLDRGSGGAGILRRGAGRHREGVNRTGKLLGQNVVDPLLARHPGQAGECIGHHLDAEVAFPLRPGPRVAAMKMRLVDDGQAPGHQSSTKLGLNPGSDFHGVRRPIDEAFLTVRDYIGECPNPTANSVGLAAPRGVVPID